MPVYKDKNKHWYFVVTINYKQYKRVKYNGEYMLSKTEALSCEHQFIESLKGKDTESLTMLDLFNEYINASKTSLKASTQYNYQKFKNNYLKDIENKKISKITPADILAWRNFLSSCPVSSVYKNRMQNIMKSILDYGSIMYGLNGKLQFSLLQPFKDNNVKPIELKSKYLEIANFKRLIESLDKTDYYYIVLWVLYFTGLRIGELSALQVKDITKDFIIVNKDYSRVGSLDIIQAPKNKNSVRKIPLDPITSSMLQEFIKNKNADEIVFHQKGKFLNQQKLRRKINILQANADLEDYDITPHTLRHSYSSNLKKLGYNEYVIAKLMGNTPQVASSVYIHANLNYDEISKNLEKL